MKTLLYHLQPGLELVSYCYAKKSQKRSKEGLFLPELMPVTCTIAQQPRDSGIRSSEPPFLSLPLLPPLPLLLWDSCVLSLPGLSHMEPSVLGGHSSVIQHKHVTGAGRWDAPKNSQKATAEVRCHFLHSVKKSPSLLSLFC